MVYAIIGKSYQWDKNLSVVKFLIEKGADVHTKTKQGYSTSYVAGRWGHPKTAAYLVSQGASKDDAVKGYREYKGSESASLAMLNLIGKAVKKAFTCEGDCPPVSSSQNNATSKPSQSSSKGSKSAFIKSITREGKYTIVKCSIGKDIRVHHDSYGQCSDNYDFGSNDCSYKIKKAQERCTRR